MKKQYIKPTLKGIYYIGEEVMQKLSGWESSDGTAGGGVNPPSGGEPGSEPGVGGDDGGEGEWGGGW